MSKFYVGSEVGQLRRVMLHRLYRSSYHLTPASNRCLVYATLVRTHVQNLKRQAN